MMPIKIDCPECGGDGYTAEHDPCDPHIDGICENCPIQIQCETCEATGKITVYTQEELNKAVQEEREAWILKMLNLRDICVESYIDNVYHEIYSYSEPTFTKTKPWAKWEAIRARSK